MKAPWCLALFAAVFVNAAPLQVVADSEGPQSEKAKEIEVLVDKAAALINSQGTSVFAEFRKGGSEWLSGDTYLFILNIHGTTLFNGAFPKLEGRNNSGLKDPNGKLMNVEMMEVAQTKGSGWVDYLWPKPGQTTPSLKWSYVRRVNLDGVPGLVGAGFYPE